MIYVRLPDVIAIPINQTVIVIDQKNLITALLSKDWIEFSFCRIISKNGGIYLSKIASFLS